MADEYFTYQVSLTWRSSLLREEVFRQDISAN